MQYRPQTQNAILGRAQTCLCRFTGKTGELRNSCLIQSVLSKLQKNQVRFFLRMRAFTVQTSRYMSWTICWLHRCCAGLSKACFAKVCASEEPFLCPNCTVTKQANEITDLRNSIAALSQAVNNLKSAVVEHSCTEPTGSRAGSRVSWAEVARGNSHGARHGGKHKGSSNNASGVPDNASIGRVSNNATGSDDGQNSSRPDTSPRAAKRSTNRNLIKFLGQEGYGVP